MTEPPINSPSTVTAYFVIANLQILKVLLKFEATSALTFETPTVNSSNQNNRSKNPVGGVSPDPAPPIWVELCQGVETTQWVSVVLALWSVRFKA